MSREKNTAWIEEQMKYKAEMKELRKKHLREYWDRQTQVENAYLDKFREERLGKQKRDLDRWRTAICNISLHTKKQITDLQTKESRLLQRMKVKDLFDTKKKMENKMMLDVM